MSLSFRFSFLPLTPRGQVSLSHTPKGTHTSLTHVTLSTESGSLWHSPPCRVTGVPEASAYLLAKSNVEAPKQPIFLSVNSPFIYQTNTETKLCSKGTIHGLLLCFKDTLTPTGTILLLRSNICGKERIKILSEASRADSGGS